MFDHLDTLLSIRSVNDGVSIQRKTLSEDGPIDVIILQNVKRSDKG